MISHLKLLPKRGFDGGYLENLGKITVICGKNNSGKSTVLDSIQDPGTRFRGFSMTDIDQEILYEFLIMGTGWGGNNLDLNQSLKQHINAIISNQSIWYADDFNKFSQEYVKQNSLFRNYSLGRNPQASYNELFQPFSTSTLIAKRKIETRSHAGLSEEIESNAKGILSNIFLSKNQSIGSMDHNIYIILQKCLKTLSGGFSFDVTQVKGGDIALKFSDAGSNWYNADECGQGLHELLTILFFCYATSHEMILIEEIESHLHPHMQKQILRHLREVPEKQFILTTHSSTFLDPTLVDKIYSVKKENVIKLEEVTSKAAMLKELGYSISDNLISDLIILVEGPSDIPIIEEFLIKKAVWQKYEIKIWAMGGDIMDQHDLSIFKQAYKVIALIDLDPHSNNVRRKFIESCENHNIPVTKLERYAIENYFSLNSLRSVFGSQIKEDLIELCHEKSIEDQIGINVKRNNRKLARSMDLKEIEGTDLDKFLDTVSEICNS